jgi:predicted kinase
MAPFRIPDPSLVLLVGAAGAGKSTLAARLFAPDEVVSSDALRAVVSGDEADQGATRVAFRILHRTVDRRLAKGLLTVIDATNAIAAHRSTLVRRAAASGIPVVAIVFDFEPTTIHAQNAARVRVVDRDIVDRHVASIRATVDDGQLEVPGLSVLVLRSPAEAAALEIERRPTAVAPSPASPPSSAGPPSPGEGSSSGRIEAEA